MDEFEENIKRIKEQLLNLKAEVVKKNDKKGIEASYSNVYLDSNKDIDERVKKWKEIRLRTRNILRAKPKIFGEYADILEFPNIFKLEGGHSNE